MLCEILSKLGYKVCNLLVVPIIDAEYFEGELLIKIFYTLIGTRQYFYVQ